MPPASDSTVPQLAAPASSAFSLYAPYYDAEHAANPIARWTRRRSLQILKETFTPGSELLEVGCGTGTEAIALARVGIRVLATDAAPAMIGVLRAKLARGGPAHDVAGLVETNIVSAGSIGALLAAYGPESFDGAYSSFGPLNCEPEIEPVLSALRALIRPGGRVVLSVIGKHCLWEVAWHLVRRESRKAFRRWAGRSAATVRGEWFDLQVPVYYWSLSQLERAAAPYFAVERRMALTWLLPPQYLGPLVRRAPRFFSALARLERRTAHRRPFNSLGDHTLLVLRRRP